jgi:HSP20 family protein
MTLLTRWNPIREMQHLQNQFDLLFEPFARNATRDDWPVATWMPPVDIEESGDMLYVRAEIPGIKPEDIDIRFENGVLTLRGERRFENQNNDRNFHRVERAYGSFVRSFTLPSSIDAEKVSATYRDGILELTMPKREEAKPRKIEIRSVSEGAKQIETK